MPNLEGVAQKMGLPCPFCILDIFGGKSKSEAPRAFIFGAKRIPTEVNTDENLVLISQITLEKFIFEHFVFSIHPQICIKLIVFENYFYTYLRMN